MSKYLHRKNNANLEDKWKNGQYKMTPRRKSELDPKDVKIVSLQELAHIVVLPMWMIVENIKERGYHTSELHDTTLIE